MGYNSDNCSVMKGSKNSVLSRLLGKQPRLINMGCICHLANLATAAGVKKIPYPIDELLVDIFYHFHHRYTIFDNIYLRFFHILMPWKQRAKRLILLIVSFIPQNLTFQNL